MRKHAPLGWAGLALSLAVMLCGAPAHAQNRSGQDGWLGIISQSLTPELQDGLDYRGEGVLVNRVVEDSPAYRAGLEKGDVIVSVEGRSVNSPDDLAQRIRAEGAGTEVSIRIYRDGERRTLSARLSSRPGEEGDEFEKLRDLEKLKDLEKLGDLKVKDLEEYPDSKGKTFMYRVPNPNRARLGVSIEDGEDGAKVLNVIEGSAAERAGIREGDVITRVSGERISDAEDLIETLRGKTGTVEIELSRRGNTRTVEAELEARTPRTPRAPRVFRMRDPSGFDWHENHGDRMQMLDEGKSSEELRRELTQLRRELADLKRELEELRRNR